MCLGVAVISISDQCCGLCSYWFLHLNFGNHHPTNTERRVRCVFTAMYSLCWLMNFTFNIVLLVSSEKVFLRVYKNFLVQASVVDVLEIRSLCN